MKIDNSKIQISNYSPQHHNALLSFMASQYENRSIEYLDWWLTNLDEGGSQVWKTAVMVYYEGNIVACCTSNPFSLNIGGNSQTMFYESNTIVVQEFRGLGIGKLIYSEIQKYNNRITIGLTKSAYAIQTKKLNNCFPMLDIRVYVSANKYCLKSIINKLTNKETNKIHFPNLIEESNYIFSLIKREDDMYDFPNDGVWMDDLVEIVRTKEWLVKRFINIYRKDYYIYRISKNNTLIGYSVFRKGRIYGIGFISIVDFRCRELRCEKAILNVANIIAKKNKIGFTFCMSSRIHSIISFSPLTIRIHKKIKNVTVVEKIKDEKILFTSADSNLDFVYYE